MAESGLTKNNYVQHIYFGTTKQNLKTGELEDFELPDSASLVKIFNQDTKFSYISAKLLLEEAYQDTYSIFKHIEHAHKVKRKQENARPLAAIAFHEVEKSFYEDRYTKLLDEFIDCKVKDLAGISWEEYLNLPVREAKLIVELCRKKTQERQKAEKAALDDLNAK